MFLVLTDDLFIVFAPNSTFGSELILLSSAILSFVVSFLESPLPDHVQKRLVQGGRVKLCSAVCVRPDGPVRGSPVHHHAGAPETLRQVRRADPEGQRDVHDPAARPDGNRPDGAADGAPQQHAARERTPGAVQHEA